MPNPTPAPNPLTDFAAAGLASLLIFAVLAVLAFIFSAWLAGIWLRLLVRFHRSWFNQEYARMRGQYIPTRADRPRRRTTDRFEDRWDARERGPRDW